MTTGRPQPQRETRTQAVLAQLRTYGLPQTPPLHA